MTTEKVRVRAGHLKDFFAKVEREAQSGEFDEKYSSYVKNIFYELLEKVFVYLEEINYENYEKILGRDMM